MIGIGVVACLGAAAAGVCERHIAVAKKQAREQASEAREQASVRARTNAKAQAVARMQAEIEASKLARAKSDMDLHMTKWDTSSAPTAPQVGERSGSPAGTIVTVSMQVPPGSGPGQPVKFMAEGQSFAAAVPEGYSPGMTFHATVTLGKNFAEKDCLCKSELRTNEPRQLTVMPAAAGAAVGGTKAGGAAATANPGNLTKVEVQAAAERWLSTF